MVDQMKDSSIIRDMEWLRKIMGQTIMKDLELNNLLFYHQERFRVKQPIIRYDSYLGIVTHSCGIELGYYCKRFHWWIVYNGNDGFYFVGDMYVE